MPHQPAEQNVMDLSDRIRPARPAARSRCGSMIEPALIGGERWARQAPGSTGSREYMNMSRRWPPTGCQLRSRPSRK